MSRHLGDKRVGSDRGPTKQFYYLTSVRIARSVVVNQVARVVRVVGIVEGLGECASPQQSTCLTCVTIPTRVTRVRCVSLVEQRASC